MSNFGKRIVQFHHNGPEHLVNEHKASFTNKKEDVSRILSEHTMPWNDGEHRRKFIKVLGKFVDENNTIHDGEIMFWNEFEGCSKVEEIEYKKKLNENMPGYLHTPIYKTLNEYIENPIFPLKLKEEVVCLQNTDPYVFGDFIIYSNCHQGKNEFLKKLAPGSLVVMGSKSGEFRADTVLVIDEPLATYSKNNYEEVKALLSKGIISQVFWDNTIVPLLSLYESDRTNKCGIKSDEDVPTYTFYKTVNFDKREKFNGMFSFFPCKPYCEKEDYLNKIIGN